MGLLFREHPKAQPEGGFRRSPGSNLRPLVYKASDLTTAPRSCNPKVVKGAELEHFENRFSNKMIVPQNCFE